MRRALLLVAVGVTALALVVGVALATPPSGATTTLLTRATLGEFKAKNDGIKVKSVRGSADSAIVKVVIEPGGSTGWHHHPGVGMVQVKSGTVTHYDAECRKTAYKAGTGFVEKGERHVARNEGNVNAVLYATFIVPSKTPAEGLRIDDPRPKNCNVR